MNERYDGSQVNLTMENNIYTSPEIEVIAISTEGVLCTSGIGSDSDDVELF